MEDTLYSNGDICKYGKIDGSVELALIFSSFANDDDDTILAIPLSTSVPKSSIPFLIGGNIMYIRYCDMFRIRRDELFPVIGRMDPDGIEMVIQSISSAFRGILSNISIPVAVLHEEEKANFIINQKSISTIIENDSAGRNKYTKEDYDLIVDNYQTNMSMLLTKYGLKNKQALYKLKYTLQQRYGKNLVTTDSNNTSSSEDESDGE